ncbi:UDP-glucose dehydrogenase family protein [Bacillus sp. FJAT-45350]|uniref:UDP-glucose dehydrogenase family protein n=1 Tax=Bacillus sp. FJAT-45350 TaxID=2011014 RepID=UPI000BB9AC33|nr:UDP-glucose/GDP-mannose dehydrogenase family protein [Bacillus sp. FJAT-45350]
MEICIVGAGYVGLTTAAILSDKGHHVHSVDIMEEKIQLLNKGKIPIYEPELDSYIIRNIKKGTLNFSTKIPDKIKASGVIIIAVGTPSLPDGSTNLSYIKGVVDTIANNLNSYKIIMTKSTVPPGTNEWIHKTLVEKGINEDLFDVVSNPEFLKEGTAIADLLNPDKTVIGSKSNRPIPKVQQLYKGFHGKFIMTSLTGAELIKYASNAFLATKISFINEMARICDAYGVNIDDIAKGIGTDPRIGSLFLRAGLGYGGSCFPKDISSLHHSASKKNVSVPLLEATMNVNKTQIDMYLNKLTSVFQKLENKKITVWGLTFKPNTGDLRFSQSLALIDKLLEYGSEVHAYDPLITSTDRNITIHDDIYQSIHNSEILIVATEWDTFKSIDWSKVHNKMNGNILLDGRNMFHPSTVKKFGFHYLGMGRPE